jgi:uncharacterized protein
MRVFFQRFAILLLLLLAPVAQAAPPLWAVNDPAKPGTVYLYGTIHLLPKGISWRNPPLDRVLPKADRLLLEIDMTAPDMTARAGQAMLAGGLLTDGRSLDQLLSPPVYEQVLAKATAGGLPEHAIRRFRPWMASLTLTQLSFAKLGFSPDDGVEKQLLAAPGKPGRQVLGLETIEQQMGFFASISDAAGAKMLEETLSQLGNAEAEVTKLKQAWLSGKPEDLLAALNAPMQESPELYDVLITKRNQAWLTPVRAQLDTPGITLVAVGAGHLYGNDGLIALLRAQGLTVTRLDR